MPCYTPGASRADAASRLDSAAASNPHVKLFVPSPLADAAFVSTLSPTAQRDVYASALGVSRGVARAFAAIYRSKSPQAIFGYAAMQAVLHVLAQAGSKANDRATVVKHFMSLRYSDSVLGPYAINDGDTSFSSFLIERMRRDRLVTIGALQG